LTTVFAFERRSADSEHPLKLTSQTKTDFTKESPLRANETTERARAEALFKKEEQIREGEKAMAEYKAAQQAIREKTARLRALRLARGAAKQSRH